MKGGISSSVDFTTLEQPRCMKWGRYEVQSIWGGHRTGLYHMAVWYRTRTQHNIRTRTRIWKSRRFREIHRYLSVQFSTWKMEHSSHQLSWGFSSLYRLLKLTEFGVGIIFIQILKIIHNTSTTLPRWSSYTPSLHNVVYTWCTSLFPSLFCS